MSGTSKASKTAHAEPGERLSAIPSPLARGIAFAAILIAGICGGLIGWAVVKLQCSGQCTKPASIGALISTLVFAGGTAIVAVLVMRAMAEWTASEANL